MTLTTGLGVSNAAGSNQEAQIGTELGPVFGPLSRQKLSNRGEGQAGANTSPFCPQLKTYNGRQYVAYWTYEGDLVVAVRDLPEGEWTQSNTGIQIDNWDPHWSPGLGIGPKGHIFISYSVRVSEVRSR
ncbi:BNR-4 repeat-containing protein [Halocatena marina]|uniref:BNR-4 repeat-containing protein n=2 Tax=Halocatena marina TaxID=2934937 RepID=A0ABD5YUT6_9EURY